MDAIWKFVILDDDSIWLVHKHGNFNIISYRLEYCPICKEPPPNNIIFQCQLIKAQAFFSAYIEGWTDIFRGSIMIGRDGSIKHNSLPAANRRELEKEFIELVKNHGHHVGH